MSYRHVRVLANDKRWERLEKVWLEEGLSTVELSERFGIGKAVITSWLIKRHGTSISDKHENILNLARRSK